jgi:ATP-dependent RNA helicase DeaD
VALRAPAAGQIAEDEPLLPRTEKAAEGSSSPLETEDSSDYIADVSFEDLPLSDALRQAIAEKGYRTPTPVQAATFGPVFEGQDLIVRSKTGTGKTAAFGIPLLERVPAGAGEPRVLVLCPTRELALQVADELQSLGKYKGSKVVAIYGGASMSEQISALRAGGEIIAGTPGRVYDHLKRGTLDLSHAQAVVLDEADEMLSMGFFEEVTRILDMLPKDRQTLLFSATVPPDIQQIVQRYLRAPETILLSGDDFTVAGIDNIIYYTVDAYPKPRNLLYLVEMEEPDTAIVFCNTRDDTSLVAAVLDRNGYDAELLNGDLPQKERERVMGKVKAGEVRFMVATDIAARGIDISDLSHVINYSLPEDPAVYLHRVGRTGRIGKEGTAISLVGGRELVTLTSLEKKYGIHFEVRKLPTPEAAHALWTERHVARLREGSQSSVYEAFLPLARELKERPDGEALLAFALKYFFHHLRIDRAHQRPAEEPKAESAPPPSDHPRPPRQRAKAPHRDRPAGKSRRERSPEGAEAQEAGDARLYLNWGEADLPPPEAFAASLASWSGLPPGLLRPGLSISGRQAWLKLDEPGREKLLALNGAMFEGKSLRVEMARAKSRRRARH